MSNGLNSDWHSAPTKAIAYFIALNSINYMFWSLETVADPRKLARYQFDGVIGAAGMHRAFDRMWGTAPNLIPVRDRLQAYSAPIDAAFVRNYFGDIPDALGQAESLGDVFKGSRLEEAAHKLYVSILDTRRLTLHDAALLHAAFPCAYSDPYHKRSQLALLFIAGYFSECGFQIDTSDLTVAADYQLPRMLRGMGIITFPKIWLPK